MMTFFETVKTFLLEVILPSPLYLGLSIGGVLVITIIILFSVIKSKIKKYQAKS